MMKKGELSKEEYRHASHEACELKSFVHLGNLSFTDVTPRMRRVS